MPDVEKISVQVSLFSVCVCFLSSTGVADIKAWPWSDPEAPVASRSISSIKIKIKYQDQDQMG